MTRKTWSPAVLSGFREQARSYKGWDQFTSGNSLEKSELSICPCRFFRFHVFRRIGP